MSSSKAQEAIVQHLEVQGYIQVAKNPESTFAKTVLAECDQQLAAGQLKEVPSIGGIRTFQSI